MSDGDLSSIYWLVDSKKHGEAANFCCDCAHALDEQEPGVLVDGWETARESDSPATCERCGCFLACTVGGVEIWTEEQWIAAADKGDGEGGAR